MLDIEIYGQSRAEEIGIKIFNFPKGLKVSLLKLQSFVDRRKSGDHPWATPRKEEDKILMASGCDVLDDEFVVTNGDILHFKIRNLDVLHDNLSKKQEPFLCRPSHADYVSYLKYGKIFPGGGMFSGRMMAPFAVLGGIAAQALSQHEIYVDAYMTQIGNAKASSYYDDNFKLPEKFEDDAFRIIDGEKKDEMVQEIKNAKKNGDSVGGKIECVARNVPAGLGAPLFDSFEGKFARFLFAIPAIKAYECGIGVDFAKSNASIVNDQYLVENESVKTLKNYNGGINGGITNGEDIVFSATVKPTASINVEQSFYNTKTNKVEKFKLQGRNDACIVPRAVVLVESALAITILEFMIKRRREKESEVK